LESGIQTQEGRAALQASWKLLRRFLKTGPEGEVLAGGGK
jgi:hypothetical protein